MNQEQLKTISEYIQNRIKVPLNNFSKIPFKNYHVDNFFPDYFANLSLKHFTDTTDLYQWETKNDKDIAVKMRSNWELEFDISDEDSRRIIILYYYTKEERPNSQAMSFKIYCALWLKKAKKYKKVKVEREFS